MIQTMKVIILLCAIVAITTSTKHSKDRKWIKFKGDPKILYNVGDTNDSNDILQVEEIKVHLAINDVIQQMETDMAKFGENLERYKKNLENRLKHKAKKTFMKLPQKLELRHQYGMLFNHHGYVMAGLQSLQLFLAIDLP